MRQANRTDALGAQRAIGAMFYAPFGAAWFALGSWNAGAMRWPGIALAVAIGGFLLWKAIATHGAHKGALATQAETPETKRRDKWFHIINAGQWVVILIVGNVLANLGHGDWVIPAAIFVVGLHFLPLAGLFRNPPHWVTGGALMAIAVGAPLALGAATPAAPAGAGVVLWVSALRALSL